MIDERDENVEADVETYNRLYAMMGGSLYLVLFTVPIYLFRFIEIYKLLLIN